MNPLADTPTAVTEEITRHGGKSPTGKPMWRVILAQNRITRKYGTRNFFPDGSHEQFHDPQRDTDGNMRFDHHPLKVVRVETGYYESPRYPVRGWILEKWMPPAVYGSRETWNYDAGPFPSDGDYWMLLGPWEHLPSLEELRYCISRWNREWEARPASFEAAFAILKNEEEEEERKKVEQVDRDLKAFYRGEIKPIFDSTSLEASRIRNSIGLKSHIGAGEAASLEAHD